MPFISLGLSDGTRLGHFNTAQTFPYPLLVTFITILWPALEDRTLLLLNPRTNVPYSQNDVFATNCQVVLAAVTKEDVNNSRAPNPLMNAKTRGSGQSSATSSSVPSRSPSNSTLATAVEQTLTFKEQRTKFQAKLKSMAYARDRGCVITGVPDPVQLHCCHVLTPPYAIEYFNRHVDQQAVLLGMPTVEDALGQNLWSPAYDIGNAITLATGLHAAFDNFEWSVIRINNELRTFVFKSNPTIKDKIIRVPSPIDDCMGYDDYFSRQFPDDSVFRKHFEEAVLRNFRAAGEKFLVPMLPENPDAPELLETDSEDDNLDDSMNKAINRAWSEGTLHENILLC